MKTKIKVNEDVQNMFYKVAQENNKNPQVLLENFMLNYAYENFNKIEKAVINENSEKR